jgi:hypothetical protein
MQRIIILSLKGAFGWVVAFAKVDVSCGLWKSCCGESRRPFGEATMAFQTNVERTHMSSIPTFLFLFLLSLTSGPTRQLLLPMRARRRRRRGRWGGALAGATREGRRRWSVRRSSGEEALPLGGPRRRGIGNEHWGWSCRSRSRGSVGAEVRSGWVSSN